MFLRMARDCVAVPGGMRLAKLRRGSCYRLMDGVALPLLRRKLAWEILPMDGDEMNYYTPRVLTLVVPPVLEPVTLAELKLFLRIDGAAEDALLLDLLVAARNQVEVWLRRSLITQSWQVEQAYCSDRSVVLPLGPIISVDEVHYCWQGQWQALSTTQWRYSAAEQSITILPGLFQADHLRITYKAGYGDSAGGCSGANPFGHAASCGACLCQPGSFQFGNTACRCFPAAEFSGDDAMSTEITGKLRHRFFWQRRMTTPDILGGETDSWQDMGEIWVGIVQHSEEKKALGGAEIALEQRQFMAREAAFQLGDALMANGKRWIIEAFKSQDAQQGIIFLLARAAIN